MAVEYLDKTGLSYFFGKLKALFATKDVATQSTDGLMSSTDKAKLDGLDALTGSGSGATVVIGDTSGLALATVYGKSIQSGTPTPSSPVPIQVVEPANLLESLGSTTTISGVVFTKNSDGSYHVQGTATATVVFDVMPYNSSGHFTVQPGTYTLTGCPSGGSSSKYKLDIQISSSSYKTDYGSGSTFTANSAFNVLRCRIVVYSGTQINADFYPQLVAGNEAKPYVQHGCIAVNYGGVLTPVNLQGNVLASLPDGTTDILTVDSVGHAVLEKSVGEYTVAGNESGDVTQVGSYYRFYSSVINNMPVPKQVDQGVGTSGLCTHSRYAVSYGGEYVHAYAVNTKRFLLFSTTNNPLSDFTGAKLYYSLATSQEIDLGYIDVPVVQNGTTVSVVAQVTPTIMVKWWTEYAEPIARALRSLMS